MAQKFLTDIELTRGLKDSSGDLGNSGQVLSSTGTGLNWINANSAASVVYQDGFTGDGNTTAFTLANSLDNENKSQVYIDGVYQHKDTYSLSNTTLTFSTAPPNLSDIEVISFSSVSSADDILYDDDFTSAGLMKTDGSGTYSIVTDNSSNWNTAYTYSQVGHLPLAGGTLTGGLTGTTATFTGNITTSGNINAGSSNYLRFTAASSGSDASVLFGNTAGTGGSLTFKRNSDASVILRLDADGQVGIGTASPSGLTHFYGNGNSTYIVNQKNSTKWSEWHVGGTNHALIWDSTADMRFMTTTSLNGGGASEKMRITSAGNVGIGTTNPQDNLHIASTLATIRLEDSDNNYYHRIRGNGSNLILVADAGDAAASSSIRFQVDADEKMRLTHTGRLGIGTANPLSTLQITSGESGAASPWTNADELVLESAGNAGLAFQTPNTGAATIAFQDPESVQAGFIQYLHTDNLMRFATNGNNIRAVIDSSGNVGIGKTSPSQKLDVEGSIRLNSELQIFTGTTDIGQISNSGGALNIQGTSTRDVSLGSDSFPQAVFIEGSNGQVGIGTTSPAQKVHLLNGGFAYMRFTSQSYGAVGFDIGQHTNGTIYLNNRDNTAMVFMTNNAERMNILAGGEINFYNKATINSPSGASSIGFIVNHSNGNKAAELIHGGSGDEGQLKLYDSNSETVRIAGENNISSFINSGNVGIGVTSPSEILQINKNSAGNVVGGYFTNSQANTGAEQVSLAFGLNRSGGDFVRQIKAITFGAEQQWTGTPSTVDGFLSFSTVANETVAERMRIDSNGVLQLTTTSNHGFVNANGTSLELDVNRNPETGAFSDTGKSHARINLTGVSGGSYIIFNTATSNNTTATEKMRLASNGNLGINTTSPDGRLDVRGAISSGMALEDENVSLTSTGGTPQATGTLEISQGWSASTSNGDTIVFRHNSTSWKAWILHYNFASTNGVTVGVIGGYWNNSGSSSNTFIENNLGASVAVTHGGTGNQNIIVTFTFTALGTHPLSSFKYIQSGGDGKPLASKTSITLNS